MTVAKPSSNRSHHRGGRHEVSNPSWLLWLTQPVATVSAALIAVVAAGIAYAGVTKTTRTARRETRRTEKVAVLTEAFDAIHELTRANSRVVALEGTTSRAKRVAEADAGAMKELGDAYYDVS